MHRSYEPVPHQHWHHVDSAQLRQKYCEPQHSETALATYVVIRFCTNTMLEPPIVLVPTYHPPPMLKGQHLSIYNLVYNWSQGL